MQRIEPSGIRRIFELMATMEDPINLSIGQAHFDAPVELVEAAARAMRAGHNRYTVTQGLPDLNARILDLVASRYGHRPEACMVTSGVSGGIMLGFMALLDPDDEVLLPDPHFTMYRHIASMVGARSVFYDTYPVDGATGADRRFGIDLEQLEARVTDRTKVVFLNSPSNPTGGLLTRDELREAVRIADKVGAWVISDEIYDEFVYDEGYASPVGMGERVLQLGGFSKTYGIPGWRMGYATGSAALLDNMKMLQQFSFVCAPAPFQHAVLEVGLDLDMQGFIDEYRGKRDRLVRELHPAFDLVAPGGSFYAFPRLPGGVGGDAFVEAAIEKKLLIVPGKAFSQRDTHFRLSFAADEPTLDRGIRALNELAERFAH